MKKFLTLLLSGAMALSLVSWPSKAYAATDLTANLKAHYNFDEDASTTIDNVASDQSTYNGTLNGSGVSLVSSDSGKALKFDSTMDSYMEVANMLNTATDSFSISMWYNYDATIGNSSKNTVLLQQNGSGRSLLLLTPSGQFRTYVNAQNVDSNNAATAGKWQHVLISYNHDTKDMTFYVNGVKDSTKATGTNVVNATTSLLIGRHKNGGNDPQSMKGLVDEIRFYSEVVSEEKAQAIYADKQEVFQPVATPDPDAPANVTTININADNVIQTIDGSIFGINHRYAFNGYGTYDEENQVMKEDFSKLYRDAGFGSIRYPGGTISNLFNWKTTLGPQEERKNQIHGFYNYSGQGGIASNFGIGEIATFAQENGSEIVYVYSIGRGNAKDAADLIEYLNAEVGTNPNGGIDWAQVRAENGHEEPYNVRYFEIGNEMQQGGTDGSGSQQYWLGNVGNAEDAYISGGTATFNKQYAVNEEDWNVTESYSKGTPNQVWWMRYANVENEDAENFVAYVEGSVKVYINNEQWTIVEDLSTASATDKVCYVNPRNGSITFGDGVHGMIPPKGQQVTVDYKVQRDGFAQISQAMRETTEAINAAENSNRKVYVYSSYETNGFINKMHNLGYDSLYDGLTIHPYSGTPSGGGNTDSGKLTFYNDAINRANNKINDVKNYVNNMRQYDTTKVPVISEFGIFRSTDPLVRSQAHALYIARSIMGYVEAGSPYIQKHCLVDWYSSGADALGPTQQAVIQAVALENADTKTGTGDFAFFATPSANIFEIYNTAFDGNKILETTVTNAPTNNLNTAEVYAMTSKDNDGNLYVAVVNYAGESVEVKIAADGYETANAEVVKYTSASETFDAENTLENPDVVEVQQSSTTLSDTSTITVDGYSFTVFKVCTGSINKDKFNDYMRYLSNMDKSAYTEESVRKLEQAMVYADQGLMFGGRNQAEVDNYYLQLKEARNDLVLLPLIGALEKVVAKADAAEAKKDLYTTESYEAMTALKEEAKAIISDRANKTQAEIDEVKAQLQEAVDHLDLANGDASALETLLASAKILAAEPTGSYDAAYLAQLKTVITEVEAFLAGDDKRQSVIDANYETLQLAMEYVTNPPLIAENLINKKANDVTVQSYSSQCGGAGEPSENGTGQAFATIDYDNNTYWHSNWSTHNGEKHTITYNLGKEYTLTDVTFLPRQGGRNGDIHKFEVYVGNSTDYTQNTLTGEYVFANTGSLDPAQWYRAIVRFNGTFTGQYVTIRITGSYGDSGNDKFASMAEIRFYGIDPLTEPEVPSVDKDALFDAIDAAESTLAEADKYTEDSFNTFKAAYYNALAVAEKEDATQEEVDNALSTLEAAISVLTEKPQITVPAKVTGLVAKDKAYNKVALTWNASEGATEYDVYQKAHDSEKFEKVATVSEAKYTATVKMTGKENKFYVVAKNEAGASDASKEVAKATTLHGTVKLNMKKVSTAKFELSWNKIAGATRYIIYSKRGSDEWKKVLTLGKDKLSYVTAELPNGEYSYIIRAARYDSSDRVMTAKSNAKTGTVEAIAPTLTVKVSGTKAALTWNKLEGVTYYQVLRKTSKEGKYTVVKTTSAQKYTANVSKTKTYYFKVRGYKAYKSGANSKYNVYTPYSAAKAVKAK